jgi:5-methyltetrahydrofolate--homocysteine methyltransferase
MTATVPAFARTGGRHGGERYLGCNDYLVLQKPAVIEAIHRSFLEAGCDVVETCSFRANRLTMAEYGLEDQVGDINRAAAQLARKAADSFSTAERRRFVAGSIGPSGMLPSSSDPKLSACLLEGRCLSRAGRGVDPRRLRPGRDLALRSR